MIRVLGVWTSVRTAPSWSPSRTALCAISPGEREVQPTASGASSQSRRSADFNTRRLTTAAVLERSRPSASLMGNRNRR